MFPDLWTTTVALDPAHPHAASLRVDMNRLHGFTMRAIPRCRHACEENLLWRLTDAATGPEVLVQTRSWVDPENLTLVPGVSGVSGPFNLGEKIAPMLLPGSAWRFQVRVNASRQVGRRREPLREPKQVLDWLSRQVGEAGVTDAEVTVVHERAVHLPARGMAMNSALLAGTLVVGDPMRMALLLSRGLGRNRAYGFGLLQIAPVLT